MLPSQRTDEQIAFPFRKQVARVEHHAGRRDGWHPEIDRLIDAFHAVHAVAHRHVLASVSPPRVVLRTVRYVGPAVVVTGSNNVDLVAALRSMIGGPQFA